jgi:hypothetical protein
MASPFPTPTLPEPTLPQPTDLQLIEQENEPEDPYKDIGPIITGLCFELDRQERPVREVLIKTWKYLELLWTGIANFYWNSTTNQWQPITYDDIRHLSDSSDLDPTLLNKTVNMLRPYGESIIGVLTTDTPRVKFFPENADNVDDINTAKAYSNIERKVQQDVFIKQKIAKIIKYLLTGGAAFGYNYSHTSEKYGTVNEPQYGTRKFRIETYTCSECGGEITSNRTEIPDPEVGSETLDISRGVEQGLSEAINEPLDDEKELQEQPLQAQNLLHEQSETPEEEAAEIDSLTCPYCQTLAPPMIDSEEGEEQFQKENLIIPKTRQQIEIYGPLNVKIPTKACKKEDVFFLFFEEEVHEAIARDTYPHYKDEIKPGPNSDLAYDRWARAQYENMGEINSHYVTIRKAWLRPSAYEALGDDTKCEKLKELFPNGLVAVFSNQNFLFAEASALDDHWTISKNPVYERLYGDPLLKAGIPLQETANDLFQLELETVKYSIPQTFADPLYFDFEAYSKSKAQPGLLYPMKASPSGRPMSDVFFETRTATLPKEVEVLENKIQSLFQFVLGVFPSVFGGEGTGGKTLGEYEQSRAQALQRLNINPWDIVVNMYAEMMAKTVKHYAEDILEDESFVEAKGTNFINVWIKKSELQGNIGEVRPEVIQQFPTSWGQKKSAILELMGLNNEMINGILFHPENVNLLSQYLSIEQLYIPGDDQRNKQLSEIKNLIAGQPMMGPETIDPNTGMPGPGMPMGSSVPIEPEVDNNEIHAQTLEAFVCSEVGQTLKEFNPPGYMNCLAHLQEHQQAIAMAQMQQMQQQAMMNPQQQSPKQGSQKVGEANV